MLRAFDLRHSAYDTKYNDADQCHFRRAQATMMFIVLGRNESRDDVMSLIIGDYRTFMMISRHRRLLLYSAGRPAPLIKILLRMHEYGELAVVRYHEVNDGDGEIDDILKSQRRADDFISLIAATAALSTIVDIKIFSDAFRLPIASCGIRPDRQAASRSFESTPRHFIFHHQRVIFFKHFILKMYSAAIDII